MARAMISWTSSGSCRRTSTASSTRVLISPQTGDQGPEDREIGHELRAYNPTDKVALEAFQVVRREVRVGVRRNYGWHIGSLQQLQDGGSKGSRSEAMSDHGNRQRLDECYRLVVKQGFEAVLGDELGPAVFIMDSISWRLHV